MGFSPVLLPGRSTDHPALPLLPRGVRYYDDFDDEYHTITDLDENDTWIVRSDGVDYYLEFERWEPYLRHLIKLWCADLLAQLAPRSTEFYGRSAYGIPPQRIFEALNLELTAIQPFWNLVTADGLRYHELTAMKSVLHYLCRTGIGRWKTEWDDLITSLPLYTKDKYASVRTGDCFLDIHEEAALIRAIDEVATTARAPECLLPCDILIKYAVLVCCYQFGLRPKQVAMLQLGQVRIWDDTGDEAPPVHLRFTMIKQQTAQRVFPMLRKVKQEWGPIFARLVETAKANNMNASEKLFGMAPRQIGQLVLRVTTEILGHARSANDLRHSAAQRLADAGAPVEVVTDSLGHIHLDTALIYFRHSPSQAEQINRALAISPIYKRVVRVAHDRFINAEELSRLKGDQQIGGLPHGFPIAGIGGCLSGQPACPYSPVMSCYGCQKFMPLNDPLIHQRVLNDFRGVVKQFEAASRGEPASPAYMQLCRTLTSIQDVIEELEATS